MAVFDPVKYDHLINKMWMRDSTEEVYTLYGIIYCSDDWYWVMIKDNKLSQSMLLSCVGDIEGFGFTPVQGYIKDEK